MTGDHDWTISEDYYVTMALNKACASAWSEAVWKPQGSGLHIEWFDGKYGWMEYLIE